MDDRAQVKNFTVILDNKEVYVVATNDSKNIIYSSFEERSKDIIDIATSTKTFLNFRIIDYIKTDAQYTLLVPNGYSDKFQWFLTCPLHGYSTGAVPCVLSGKIGSYIAQMYISPKDVRLFSLAVDEVVSRAKTVGI